MLYVGLMSGTSLDGIDVALADFGNSTGKLLDFITVPFSQTLCDKLLRLCSPANSEIDLAGQASAELAIEYAEAVKQVLTRNNLSPAEIQAIGCHGQTVRHRPEFPQPFTLQLVDANRLAVLTGIDVVSDFRSKDIALGGQGAPLAPGFHVAHFAQFISQQDVVLVNIGGIANLTLLPQNAREQIIGFDSGPGNGLMDAWMQRHYQAAYDKDGKIAASGSVLPSLLKTFLADDYFALPAPKSTGRELFNLNWLDSKLNAIKEQYPPQDVMATLLAFTVASISDAIESVSKNPSVFVCGGGAYNEELMTRLRATLGSDVQSTSALGLSPDAVEAMAFAWLAYAHLNKVPGNIPSVTGAQRQAILGTLTPWQ